MTKEKGESIIIIWINKSCHNGYTVRKETAMEIFTDVEKQILEGTYKSYKWIARDKNGLLYVYDEKPNRDEGCGFFYTEFGSGYSFNRCFSDVLFSNVTWENSPIQFRDDEILTPKEREYLSFVFKPFANDVLYVRKIQSYVIDNIEYIEAVTCKGGRTASMLFPDFKRGTMYKGMKPKTKYTLKELGIVYDE